jgi:hypothetical protein
MRSGHKIESGGILDAGCTLYDVHFSYLKLHAECQPHEFQPDFDISCSSRFSAGGCMTPSYNDCSSPGLYGRMSPSRGPRESHQGRWSGSSQQRRGIHNNYSARRVYPILQYGCMVQVDPLCPSFLD